MTDKSLEVLFEEADRLIVFHGANPRIAPPQPCECAQSAIEDGYITMDPACIAGGCKELRDGPT